ncbi:MAG TPA: chaperonin GroEL [Thermoanaerobaculia bacterium]
MTHTELTFHDEARQQVLAGATALADAVRITLGPQSKRVLIGHRFGSPVACDDGVTIAKELRLADPEENLGMQVLRQAAERTGDAVGDGTTTATLLAHAIFAEGLRNVVAGSSAIALKRGVERGVAVAVQALEAMSKPVVGRQEKVQIATISAHGDPAIGEMVADAVERVGEEGAVEVEEAKGTETVLEVVEGMQIDRGYLSPYFVTDPEKMEAVLDSPLVLLTDRKVSTLKDLLPLLQQLAQSQQPLLVVADDVDGEALATLVVNKLRGVLPAAAVKAPAFGDRRKEVLADLAIVTGGKVISEDIGLKLENVTPEDLGRAERVVVTKDATTFVGGKGERAAIQGRCAELRRRIDDTTSDYDREKLEERLAKLSGGVAVIRVGAPSEAELKSRREAFDDAISSTRAAIAEGVVPGGGVALLRATAALDAAEREAEGDERTGIRIVRRALEAPLRQIVENSGKDGGVIVERLREQDGNRGFDAARGEIVDLVEAGIIDPTKVVRVALENAASVAGVLLLTDATLAEVEDEPREGRPAFGEE